MPRRGPREQERPPPPFEPVVAVDFYPEEAPFKALSQAMKQSLRTFELFEIARLILEKPERHVAVLKPLNESAEEPFFESIPDGLPFLKEPEAVAHVCNHHFDQFFDTQEVEVDAPSGNFQMVHRCGITGELIGPPNYHRYAALCKEHHAQHLSGTSFKRFQDRLESTREQEAIDGWLEKMKRQQQFTVKATLLPEGVEPPTLKSMEDARLYLISQHRDRVVRTARAPRCSGKALQLLPQNHPLRRSVDMALQQQLRFPLDTANHIRGRLRRLNFTVYKKGSKGVSLVCAVKRRFRRPDEVLADNLSELIDFLEAHPYLPTNDLPREFLGIDTVDQPGGSSAEASPDAEAAPAQAEAEAQPAPDTSAAPAESSAADTGDTAEAGEAQPQAVEDAATTSPVPEAAHAGAEEAPAAEAPAQPTESAAQEATAAPSPAVAEPAAVPESGPADEDQEKLRQLRRDLRYLIAQGYIIEYSDGTLFALPVREPVPGQDEDRPRSRASGKRTAPASGSAPAVKAPAAPALAKVSEQPTQADAEQPAPEAPEAEPLPAAATAADPAAPQGPEAPADASPQAAPAPTPEPSSAAEAAPTEEASGEATTAAEAPAPVEVNNADVAAAAEDTPAPERAAIS